LPAGRQRWKSGWMGQQISTGGVGWFVSAAFGHCVKLNIDERSLSIHVNFSLCTIGGEGYILAISFNNYGHSIPSPLATRSGASAGNFPDKKPPSSRVVYISAAHTHSAPSSALLPWRSYFIYLQSPPRLANRMNKENTCLQVQFRALRCAGLCIFYARRAANFLCLCEGREREHFTLKPHCCFGLLVATCHPETNNTLQDIRLCIIHKAAKATKVCLNPGQNKWPCAAPRVT
jgi:hypothetical protein